VKIMFEYVSFSWGNPTPYSKMLDISGKKGNQKERTIKTRNIYSVSLYHREVVILGGQGEGTDRDANKTSEGEGVKASLS